MTENRPTQPSRKHGESEQSQTTPDGKVKVQVGPEGTTLQVKPGKLGEVLSDIHQNKLEAEQGITYTTDPTGEKLVGVKKKKTT